MNAIYVGRKPHRYTRLEYGRTGTARPYDRKSLEFFPDGGFEYGLVSHLIPRRDVYIPATDAARHCPAPPLGVAAEFFDYELEVDILRHETSYRKFTPTQAP